MTTFGNVCFLVFNIFVLVSFIRGINELIDLTDFLKSATK